ncbi:MAG: DMT family transporter, partial [Gemmatimonadetes bacterium]|nr:DMT family transporter [Gemmatimonadota bacterium]
MIDWIAPALASPALFSFITLVDKQVLSGFNVRVRAFNVFVGTSQGLFSLAIVLINPLPSTGVTVILGGLGVGLLHGISLSLMFWVLSREDASRVVPVIQTSPILIAVMAGFLFDEVLGPLLWLAVVLAVGGAVLSSVRLRGGGRGIAFRPVFALLLVSSVLFAFSQLLLKATTQELSVFHTLSLRGAGLFTAMAVLHARRSTVAEMARFLRNPRRGPWLVLSEGVLPFVGHILGITAVSRGPVSLVSALMGTRPVCVFLGSLLGSRVAPRFVYESFERSE